MSKVMVDTSAWYTLFNLKDPLNKSATDYFDDLAGRKAPICTTNFIMDEILTLCRVRLGYEPSIKVVKFFSQSEALDIIRITAKDEERAIEIFKTSGEPRLSYTDCTTFAAMERLKIDQVFAFDQHFVSFGFEVFPKTSR